MSFPAIANSEQQMSVQAGTNNTKTTGKIPFQHDLSAN